METSSKTTAISELIRAVKPTLFDATFHPDLLISVLLANLMSERLEELGHHALHTPGPFASEEERTHALSKLIHYLNGRFYHARPEDFARIWGLHERDELKDREALEANDYTMSVLTNAYEHVEQFKPYAHLLSGFLTSGLFPEYVYSTVDVILRLAQTLPPVPNHPLGITSCADEAILIASLAFVRNCCNLEDIVILGSPLHYLLFLFPEGSDGYLFNGKREFFTSASWKETSESSGTNAVTDAFISRIFTCDRLITATGHRIFPLHRGTISHPLLISTLDAINRFLGLDLSARMPVIKLDTEFLLNNPNPSDPGNDQTASLLQDLNQHRTPGETGRIIREQALNEHNSLALQSWYTGRYADVPDHQVYPEAALTGYKTGLLAAEVLNIQDGIDLVRAIPGQESIFGVSKRIALPDEVLLFQTGSGNERLLLLFALLKLSEAISASEKSQISIVTEEDGWRVKTENIIITAEELSALS